MNGHKSFTIFMGFVKKISYDRQIWIYINLLKAVQWCASIYTVYHTICAGSECLHNRSEWISFVVNHVLLVCLFVRFFAGKIARVLQRECRFSSEKSNELTDQQDLFALITHLLSIRAAISSKMLINKQIRGTNSYRKSFRKFTFHALTSGA